MNPSAASPPGSHRDPQKNSPAASGAAAGASTDKVTVQWQQQVTPSKDGVSAAAAAAAARGAGHPPADKAAETGDEKAAAAAARAGGAAAGADARPTSAAVTGVGTAGREEAAAASARGGKTAAIAAAALATGSEGGDGAATTAEMPQLLRDRLSQCVDAACRDRERRNRRKKGSEEGKNSITVESESEAVDDEDPPDRMAIGHAAWGVLHSAAATWKEQPVIFFVCIAGRSDSADVSCGTEGETDETEGGQGYQEQQSMHEWIHAFAALFPCVECRTHFHPFLQREPPWTRGGRAGLSLWACKAHNYVNESLQRPLFNCDVAGLFKRWTRTQWPEPGDEEE